MAQLPPRVPIWTPTFSSDNEFLDFSSTRRATLRRSLTDFDKLEDDQLLCMFSDVDIPTPHLPVASNSSSTSEKQNSPDLANAEQGEAQSSSNPNSPPDPKRVKRFVGIITNRQSAQRSRVRKLHYLLELERSVSSLQDEVSALSPRVAFLDHQRLILNVDNSALKQRIAALAQDKIFKDAHHEALKKEIERLRKIYNQQNNSNGDSKSPAPAPALSEQLITS